MRVFMWVAGKCFLFPVMRMNAVPDNAHSLARLSDSSREMSSVVVSWRLT